MTPAVNCWNLVVRLVGNALVEQNKKIQEAGTGWSLALIHKYIIIKESFDPILLIVLSLCAYNTLVQGPNLMNLN